MLLEGLAARHGQLPPCADGWRIADGQLDLLPLLAQLADMAEMGAGAARFHATCAAALVDWVAAEADRTAIRTVAAAGGCLLNRLLSSALRRGFSERGLQLLEARVLPPNDGGLSLGQAWVAAN